MISKETNWEKIGHFSFLVGAILAIIAGLFVNFISTSTLMTSLFILGLIVGFINITNKETAEFLIASVALMLAGVVNLSIIPYAGIYLRAILSNIVVFVVPGAIIIALKTIYRLAIEK